MPNGQLLGAQIVDPRAGDNINELTLALARRLTLSQLAAATHVYIPPSRSPFNNPLAELVRDIQAKLLGAELLVKLKKIELPSVNFEEAKTLARAVATVRAGRFGYAVLVAARSPLA